MRKSRCRITVQAAYSKHRREDVLPLHVALTTLLEAWLPTKPKDQPVWPGKWAKSKHAALMLRHDLKAAGIPYVDDGGLYVDFHALRHTFITNMVKSGVAPKMAQALARHSTIDLTMNVYTSLTVHDQASALASLPSLTTKTPDETFRATGTDGQEVVPPVVPRGAKTGAIHLASDTIEHAPSCTETGDSSD